MQNITKENAIPTLEANVALKGQTFAEFAVTELQARAPHPMFANKLMLFGQFIGVWDMDVIFYSEEEKKVYSQKGEWLFFWVLDGRVIQDVLIYPNSEKNMSINIGERRIGTSLRYYNPKEDTWNIIWLGAVTGNIVFLTGRVNGEEIILEEKNSPDGSISKWIFTDITPDQFHWKGFISKDNSSSWTLEQEMFGYRRKNVLLPDNESMKDRNNIL